MGDASKTRESPTTAHQKSPPAGPNQASPGDISLPSDEDVDKNGIIEDVVIWVLLYQVKAVFL